jgi:hypothetical protein
MNALSRRPQAASQASLLALSEWQEKERLALNCAVDEQGCLLDNLTLELRVHPPEVHVDNVGDARSTVITVDTANRPGTLVFVSPPAEPQPRATCTSAGRRPKRPLRPRCRLSNTSPSWACA